MSGSQAHVAIVGGGLAGLAAAVELAERGVGVTLCEARRSLGGRAGSFREPESGEMIDHCQHVGMGCCTELLEFFRRTELSRLLRCDRTLHFFGPDGQRYDFSATPRLPAPLHLLPAFWRWTFLSRRERWQIGRGLMKLQRLPATVKDEFAADWLRRNGQSPAAIEHFWSVVLTSALGESPERASLLAARKVFVDGFLATRNGYELWTPRVPLGTLYDEHLAQWLVARGVTLRLQTPVARLVGSLQRIASLETESGEAVSCSHVIVATPWRRTIELFDPAWHAALPFVEYAQQLEPSAITAVHLWFDRPIMSLPHAVILGRLSQWVFARETPAESGEHYYQVVISASQELGNVAHDEIIRRVRDDLHALFPAASSAGLVRARVVTQREAVFSYRPGLDATRPGTRTPMANLFLAGDWTATGWPATMEGAVRSGRAAAQAVLADIAE